MGTTSLSANAPMSERIPRLHDELVVAPILAEDGVPGASERKIAEPQAYVLAHDVREAREHHPGSALHLVGGPHLELEAIAEKPLPERARQARLGPVDEQARRGAEDPDPVQAEEREPSMPEVVGADAPLDGIERGEQVRQGYADRLAVRARDLLQQRARLRRPEDRRQQIPPLTEIRAP